MKGQDPRRLNSGVRFSEPDRVIILYETASALYRLALKDAMEGKCNTPSHQPSPASFAGLSMDSHTQLAPSTSPKRVMSLGEIPLARGHPEKGDAS